MIGIIRHSRRILNVPTEGLVIGKVQKFLGKFTSQGVVRKKEGRSYGTPEENVDAPINDKPQDGSEKAFPHPYRCFGCFALLWAAVSIYMIIIGAVEDCPVNNGHIRIYLIVLGSSNLFQLIMYTLTAYANIEYRKDLFAKCLHRVNFILTLFSITWVIVGSVWVWRTVSDWSDDHSLCNNALIVSAIICLLLHYLLLLLLLSCCACVCWYTRFNTNTTGETLMN